MCNTERMEHTPDPKEWITRADAARRYGVSERTLDRLADAGKISRRKYPHRRPAVFLAVADLERAMEVTA